MQYTGSEAVKEKTTRKSIVEQMGGILKSQTKETKKEEPSNSFTTNEQEWTWAELFVCVGAVISKPILLTFWKADKDLRDSWLSTVRIQGSDVIGSGFSVSLPFRFCILCALGKFRTLTNSNSRDSLHFDNNNTGATLSLNTTCHLCHATKPTTSCIQSWAKSGVWTFLHITPLHCVQHMSRNLQFIVKLNNLNTHRKYEMETERANS